MSILTKILLGITCIIYAASWVIGAQETNTGYVIAVTASIIAGLAFLFSWHIDDTKDEKKN